MKPLYRYPIVIAMAVPLILIGQVIHELAHTPYYLTMAAVAGMLWLLNTALKHHD